MTLPPPAGLEPGSLVLHAAAWTNVDGAEDDPQGAAAVNVGGTANVAALGVPLVYYSTDYVFDGRKREPYVESDSPNPQSAYGALEAARRGSGGRAGVDRAVVLALRADRPQLRPNDAAARRGAGRGGGRRRPARVADVRRPSRGRHAPGRPAAVRRLPRRRRRRCDLGRLRRGDLRGGRARHARAPDRHRASSTHRGRRRARRTRSCAARRARPTLPHWRDGLRECLAHPRAKRGIAGVASYSFLTTWILDAPHDDVWNAIYEIERWPEWWRGVRRVEQLEQGDADGDRRPLPARVAQRHPVPGSFRDPDHPDRAAVPDRGRSRGRAGGTGRWRFFGGRETAVTYEWNVRTTSPG